MYINSRKVSLSPPVPVLSQKWAAKHGYQSARAAVCKWHAVIKAILFYPQLPPAATCSRNEETQGIEYFLEGCTKKRLTSAFSSYDYASDAIILFFLPFFYYWDLLWFSISREEKKGKMRCERSRSFEFAATRSFEFAAMRSFEIPAFRKNERREFQTIAALDSIELDLIFVINLFTEKYVDF